MVEEPIQKSQTVQDDEIDFVELLAKIWQGRKTIVVVTVLFGCLGVAAALLSPKTYQASSVFITQTSGERPSSSLGGLASLAGINLSSMGGGSGISPELYPKVINSLPFKRAMLQVPIVFEGRKITYAEYLQQRPTPLLNDIKKYTIGLPGQVIGWFKAKPPTEEGTTDTGYGLKLSMKEYELMQGLEDKIEILTNDKEGYNTLILSDPSPDVAAQMATWAEQALQERVVAYQIKSTQELFDFTQTQYAEKQQEVFELQDLLAQFTEANQNISSPYVQNERRRLEAEYNRKNTVYTELASQKEQAALQLKKDTPIFTIIDPVTVPHQTTGTSGVLILVVSMLLGVMLGIALVLVKEPLTTLRKAIQNED